MIKFTENFWECPRCGKYNRVRGSHGEQIKKCRCGRKVMITIEYKELVKFKRVITKARAIHLRCNRGRSKK